MNTVFWHLIELFDLETVTPHVFPCFHLSLTPLACDLNKSNVFPIQMSDAFAALQM